MTVAWYASFAEAIDRGEPFYRRCEACGESGWPPRHTCPACGEPAMVDAELGDGASIVAFTEIHVTTPKFKGEAPYVVALAEFEEGVRLTGQVRNGEHVDIGMPVRLGVERRGETGGDGTDEDEPGDWVVTFTPV